VDVALARGGFDARAELAKGEAAVARALKRAGEKKAPAAAPRKQTKKGATGQ
jgi:hypothetical protein